MAKKTKKTKAGRSLPYKIVRTRDAGVFACEVEHYDRTTGTADLVRSRRLWYWAGVASLSELAEKGPGNPGACKFPVPVARETVAGVIEILDVTPEARAKIEAVPVWSAS